MEKIVNISFEKKQLGVRYEIVFNTYLCFIHYIKTPILNISFSEAKRCTEKL
jgi:hypothetical protein